MCPEWTVTYVPERANFVLFVRAVGAVNGWEIDGASRLRGALAGIVGSAFFVAVYIASRAASLRPLRMAISGSAGLVCGCLCAGLLGRGAAAVAVWGLVGALLGVSSDVWLSGV
jgi:hypothetical protein